MINNKEFANKAMNIAKNYKTAYFWGAFGWPITNLNVQRLLNQYPENYAYLSASSGKQFAFDCSGLVKAILWNWNGNSSDVYGGAKYCSNGLNDLNDEGLKSMCSDVSSNFSNIKIGSLLFTSGHVGIYVGEGKCVEATPSWSGGVQISAVGNIGVISGLPTRRWQCHGKFKLIDYSVNSTTSTPPQQVNYKQAVPARYFSAGYEDQYRVTPNIGVNIRTQPSIKGAIIKAIPQWSVINCYGYFGRDENNEVWLYIQYGNIIGYIKEEFLK